MVVMGLIIRNLSKAKNMLSREQILHMLINQEKSLIFKGSKKESKGPDFFNLRTPPSIVNPHKLFFLSTITALLVNLCKCFAVSVHWIDHEEALTLL